MRRVFVTAMVLAVAATVVMSQGPVAKPPIRVIGPIAVFGGNQTPKELLVRQADVVVVGKVIEVFDAQEVELTLPDTKDATKGTFLKYKIEVAKTIKAPEAPRAKVGDMPTSAPAELKTIEIFTPQLEMQVRPLANAAIRMPVSPIATKLEKDESYVLLLRTLPDRKDFFLPAGAVNYAKADEDTIKQFVQAADVDRWPWGKEVNGLQVALLCPKQVNGFKMGNDATSVVLTVGIALRNNSKETVSINLGERDKPLDIQAAAEKGASSSADLYAHRPERKSAITIFELKPGQVMLVSPDGLNAAGFPVNLKIGEGKWKLQAVYSNAAATTADKAKVLWTGKLTSESVEAEVKASQPAPVLRHTN